MRHIKILFFKLIFFFITITAYGANDQCSKFAIIAHRGLSCYLPEASMLAYRAAADLNVQFLEVDVQRTKDHVLIAYHDDSFWRTTNIKKIFPNRVYDPVYTFTYKEVSLLRNKGVVILKLEDIINISITHPNHPGLYIETKKPNQYKGIEKEIVDLLESKSTFDKTKIIFQSFNIESLRIFKLLKPNTLRVLLSDSYYETLINYDLKLAATFANGIGSNLGNMTHQQVISFLVLAKEQNLFTHFWTVDRVDQLKQLIAAEADGVFTNCADELVELCGQMTRDEIKRILALYLL